MSIKYQFLKKNHMVQKVHLNTLLDIMIMMILDHYVKASSNDWVCKIL